jgi:hypothetical protein
MIRFRSNQHTYVLVFRLLLSQASQSDTNQELITHYVDIFDLHKSNLRGTLLEVSIYHNVKRFCQLTFLVHFITRHLFGVRSLLGHSDFLVRRILLALSRIPSSSWWIKSNIILQLTPQFTAQEVQWMILTSRFLPFWVPTPKRSELNTFVQLKSLQYIH